MPDGGDAVGPGLLDAESKKLLKFYSSLNVRYMDETGKWWRLRPTSGPGGSRWPFRPPFYLEGVDGAWIVPNWLGGEIPEPEGHRGMSFFGSHFARYDFLVVLPAEIYQPGTDFSVPAVLLPGRQGAIANGARDRFGMDLLLEFTFGDWIIDSNRTGVHFLGWKRSPVRHS